MRITKDQWKFLQDFDEATAREVQKAAKDLGSDVLEVDESKLKQAFRQLFRQWMDALNEEEPPVPPAAPAVSTSPELDDDLARQQKAQHEAAEANARAIKEAADKRWEYYIREQGLLAFADDQNDHNANLISQWFQVNSAPITAHNVDICIGQLVGQLHWAVWSPRRKLAVVESVQAEPQETLLTKYPKKEDLVKKIRSFNSREEREKFFDRWGGVSKINERLAQPDLEEVPRS